MINHPIINNKKLYKSEYLDDEIIDMLDSTFAIPNDFGFYVYEVSKDYIARPDLISYDAYGDTMFADVICKFNGISNPFELNEGMILILPAPEDVINFHTVSEIDDSEQEMQQKQRNQTRKANESIIGDTRFKIDPGAGIIVY